MANRFLTYTNMETILQKINSILNNKQDTLVTITEEEESELLDVLEIPENPKVPVEVEMTKATSSQSWGSHSKYTDDGKTAYSDRTLNSFVSAFYCSTETFDKDTELDIEVTFDSSHSSTWFFGACVPIDTTADSANKKMYYFQELGTISTIKQRVTYTVKAGYKFMLAVSKNNSATELTVIGWSDYNAE